MKLVARQPVIHASAAGLDAAPGETTEVRLRLRTVDASAPLTQEDDVDEILARRRREAEEFYASLTPAGCSDDEAMVMRRAFAGMLWAKQLFAYRGVT